MNAFDQHGPGSPLRTTRSALNILGTALAVVIIVSGLAVLAFIVMLYVGMSNFGSNK